MHDGHPDIARAEEGRSNRPVDTEVQPRRSGLHDVTSRVHAYLSRYFNPKMRGCLASCADTYNEFILLIGTTSHSRFYGTKK